MRVLCQSSTTSYHQRDAWHNGWRILSWRLVKQALIHFSCHFAYTQTALFSHRLFVRQQTRLGGDRSHLPCCRSCAYGTHINIPIFEAHFTSFQRTSAHCVVPKSYIDCNTARTLSTTSLVPEVKVRSHLHKLIDDTSFVLASDYALGRYLNRYETTHGCREKGVPETVLVLSEDAFCATEEASEALCPSDDPSTFPALLVGPGSAEKVAIEVAADAAVGVGGPCKTSSSLILLASFSSCCRYS